MDGIWRVLGEYKKMRTLIREKHKIYIKKCTEYFK